MTLLASNNDLGSHNCCSSRLDLQYVVQVVPGLLHSLSAGETCVLSVILVLSVELCSKGMGEILFKILGAAGNARAMAILRAFSSLLPRTGT